MRTLRIHLGPGTPAFEISNFKFEIPERPLVAPKRSEGGRAKPVPLTLPWGFARANDLTLPAFHPILGLKPDASACKQPPGRFTSKIGVPCPSIVNPSLWPALRVRKRPAETAEPGMRGAEWREWVCLLRKKGAPYA